MIAQAKELRQSPPLEFFASIYFQANDWWHPEGEQSAEEEGEQKPMQFSNPDLPEYED